MKEWYSCPICRKKVAMIDKSKDIEGVFVKCPMCKNEIEITNKK